jgi:hypothetical protein
VRVDEACYRLSEDFLNHFSAQLEWRPVPLPRALLQGSASQCREMAGYGGRGMPLVKNRPTSSPEPQANTFNCLPQMCKVFIFKQTRPFCADPVL